MTHKKTDVMFQSHVKTAKHMDKNIRKKTADKTDCVHVYSILMSL